MNESISDLLLARRLVASGDARALREAAGLSRAEAARAAGVSYPAIRLWESNDRRPTGDAGIAYGRFLRELTLVYGIRPAGATR